MSFHSKKLSPISKGNQSRKPNLSAFLKTVNQSTPGGCQLPCVDKAPSSGQVLAPSRPVAETVGSTSRGGIGASIDNDFQPLPAPDYRLGADSPSGPVSPMMPRAGARYPDAAASCSSSPEYGEQTDAELYATLNEYLQLEDKFQPRLCLPAESDNVEVTTDARDGAAHVLRCLKVWFDLPAEVLINAISFFDRFLTKMKVRPCHLPCISVSSMNLAIEQHAIDTKQERKISIEELVSVSQSACTARDVARMSALMGDKLCVAGARGPVSAAHWARLLLQVLTRAADRLGLDCSLLPPLDQVLAQLELAMCDALCADTRTCSLAMALVTRTLDAATPCTLALQALAGELQAHCHVGAASLDTTRARLLDVERRYHASHTAAHRQRLVWRLSERTLKVLRPTDRLTSLLPTIEEQHLGADVAPDRNRMGSESSESEETSDWPRSPVLPVYCDN